MAERIRPSSTSTFRGLVIENVLFTDAKLGSGSDATVFEVDWNGTLCAAKRLHEILLEDQSAGGVAKLISNFEAECLTWSKLHYPGVVQFLGVHMDRRSRLPVLVMEKMDTSLRVHVLGGAQQGGVPPPSEGVRPSSGDPSASVSPQPESSSRPS